MFHRSIVIRVWFSVSSHVETQLSELRRRAAGVLSRTLMGCSGHMSMAQAPPHDHSHGFDLLGGEPSRRKSN